MTWLLGGILLACVALAALAHARDGWALWRIRRSLRTGSMDSHGALRAFAIGLRALEQGWICRVLWRWRLRWDLWRLGRTQRRARVAIGHALRPALRRIVDEIEREMDEIERVTDEVEDLLQRRDL